MTTHIKLTLHELSTGRDIAIINDTLPEIYGTDNTLGAEVSMGNMAEGEYSVCVPESTQTANWHYRRALCDLTMWQYKLGADARIAEAEAARDKRRDELAATLSGVIGTQYSVRNRDLRNAIDMIIELEGKP